MTRPDKRAARFGDDFWRIPTYADVDPRKVARALRSFRPVIARMTEALRGYNHRSVAPSAGTHIGRDVLDLPAQRWSFVPHVANMAAPTLAELEAGTPIRMSLHTGTDDSQLADPAYDTRYARSSYPITWTTAGTVTWMSDPYEASGDILDRIDDTLISYDAQRSTGEQPWPFEGF